MSIPLLAPQKSFKLKIMLPVLGVMVLLGAGILAAFNVRLDDQLHASASERLETAERVFRKTTQSRSHELISKYRNVLNEPRFKAVTREADFDTLKYSMNEIMDEVLDDNEAAIATFTFFKDGEKKSLSCAKAPNLDSSEFVSSSSQAVDRAAKGDLAVDTIRVGNHILQVVALPVGAQDEIAGVLTFGVKMDGDVAREIRQLTQSEVAFVADGKVAASSLSRPESLAALMPGFESHQEPLGVKDRFGRAVVIDGEHFLYSAGKFQSLKADDKMGYVLLSSYEKPLADLLRIQVFLLAMGFCGFALSAMFIWYCVGKATRPLLDLRKSVEAVGNEDYSGKVDTSSKDEIGELARAFNQMVDKVRRSHEDLEQTVETLKSTQHQLIQSEKLSGIGEFVAGVAHELNNPLTSVMGFSELLQQGELPEQQRRYLDVIFKSAKRCQKIVQSLLSFARRHAPERKVVCANEIVESAVEILSYQMRTSNIEVSLNLNPKLPLTELDTHQMQQVFLNIINNARQAMEAHQGKGSLTIATEYAEGRVRVIFKDNGPGISPENITKIFNPFFTTKAVGKGTGLGLSLCYGIVTEHGGTITPYSNPGEGATFVIELPVSNAAASKIEDDGASRKMENPSEGVGKSVLVVDDEDSILQMIKEVLTKTGYRVDIAHDGEAALKRLSQQRYDVTLCDWKMPGLNGQEVYERLSAMNPEMSKRLIFITGDVVNESTQQFLEKSRKLCLSKPFTLSEFRSAIAGVASSN
jgi:signal transduction histidine kinase